MLRFHSRVFPNSISLERIREIVMKAVSFLPAFAIKQSPGACPRPVTTGKMVAGLAALPPANGAHSMRVTALLQEFSGVPWGVLRLRPSSESLQDRDLFQHRSMQRHRLARHLRPDPEGAFDKTQFAPDAGLELEGLGLPRQEGTHGLEALDPGAGRLHRLEAKGVGLNRRLSEPWSASKTLLRHFTCRWRQSKSPGIRSLTPSPGGGVGSRFLLASEPTESQARGFELQGMDQDHDAGMSATA